MRVQKRHLAPGIAAFLAAIAVALVGLYANAAAPNPSNAVTIRLLGVNDFHGHLEPPRAGIGGAAWLASHLDRETVPGRTIRVHAGDMVGASPLISSHFHDEPSIEATNLMRFDVGTLGNHEFDEGGDEMMRLVGRADYPYVSANATTRDGRLLLPPFKILERDGVKVGFIGITTQSTPKYLLPQYAAPYRFHDLSDSVNEWVPELERRGVEAIVVLAHAGAPGQTDADAEEQEGEILDEARQMSDAVDVVVAGHSHTLLNLRQPNASGRGDKLIVQALSYGVAFDRVDLTIDKPSGEVLAKQGSVPATEHEGVAPEPQVKALVDDYAARIAPIAKRVLGETPTPLMRHDGTYAELAADAQRSFTGADVAVVNDGSIRADVDAGPILYEEVFRAQAYDHPLLVVKLTGRQLLDLLEDQSPAVSGLALDPDGAGGTLADGRRLDPGATYSVAANALYVAGWPGELGSMPASAAGSEVEATASYLAGSSAASGTS